MMINRLLGHRPLLKLAAAAVAIGATSGGVALAASGSAPDTPGSTMPTAASSGLATADDHSGRTVGVPSTTPSQTEHPDVIAPTSGSSTRSAEATPSPSLVGLCHAWLAGAGSEHGQARSNPAFTVLVTAAGGSGQVSGFCTTLLATQRPEDTTAGDDSSEAPEPTETETHRSEAPEPTETETHRSEAPEPTESASHPQGVPTSIPPRDRP